jgi:para-aminobenzoate synthetase component I
VLVIRAIPWRDPVEAFAPFAKDPMAALLHSDGTENLGRWSYIAASPFRVIETDAALSTTADGTPVSGDPFTVLKNELSNYPLSQDNCPAPFVGGAVGFLTYELGRATERLPTPKMNPAGPAMVVGLFDIIAAFDQQQKKAWVISSGFPELSDAARLNHAEQRATWLSEELCHPATTPVREETGTWAADLWTPDLPRADIEAQISNAIGYIHSGDIFQANITQKLTAAKPKALDAWDLFRRLRRNAPSPFGAYIAAAEDFHLLSASPERFLKVSREGWVETRPIKGSRPRGQTPKEDQEFAEDLVASAKDQAENLMIVDLMRNDLSRVCETGSVAVPVQSGLESFATIHHLVSVVTGQLRHDHTAVDLLRACFPGGSVTGAPKVRAMEVIHELELTARGPYCGAVVWVGFDGAMDSSIVIRSLVVDGDTITAQAGGGIVAESDPALEYEEAMVKLRPLLAVLDASGAS